MPNGPCRRHGRLDGTTGVHELCVVRGTHAQTQRQLWVTNSYGNDVHIFDMATLELVRHIEVDTAEEIPIIADG